VLEHAYQRDMAFTNIVIMVGPVGVGEVFVMVAQSGLITNIYVQIENLICMTINGINIFIKDSLYRLKIADELIIIILILILEINIDF